MNFLIFILLVYFLALFHRFEHRVMIRDLARLAGCLPLEDGVPEGHDWRQTGGTKEAPQLKRGFDIPDKTAVLRYALPIVFAAAMMIALQDFTMAGVYILLCTAKWFALGVTLTRAEYKITLGRFTLLREALPQG
ncbi:MAG: hypothetical protein Q8K65_00415 [Alphaproteobacteria bacterium]|nr:hypothetical protein [Alphaproteobacteria bacterium]